MAGSAKKLLALTDGEARRLAAALKWVESPANERRRDPAQLPVYQICQGDGTVDGGGLADCDVVHPQSDGTWLAMGAGKIRSASTARLLCRFAGYDPGSGQGVWEPVGGSSSGGGGGTEYAALALTDVSVSCAGYGSMVVTKTYELFTRPAVRLSGRVTSGGSPVSGVTITVRAAGGGATYATTTTDSGGYYYFDLTGTSSGANEVYGGAGASPGATPLSWGSLPADLDQDFTV